MNLERVAALLPFIPLLAIPGWGVWRMGRGLRAGTWRRPGWFGHAAWVSLFLLVLVWLWGALSGGLDIEENCRFQHRQPYDDAYYNAHRDDYFRLFPLSRNCNADYDMVASWVNPAVAALSLLAIVSLTGAVAALACQRTRTQRKRG